MKEAPIVQFNCFSTPLAHPAFLQHWEQYVETEALHGISLLKYSAESKSRFQYISSQRWEAAVVKQRPARHFQESTIKMIPAGGYILSDSQIRRKTPGSSARLFAFMNSNETNIEPYVQSSLYNNLKVYQAYYESCIFSYILEFDVPLTSLAELTELLQKSHGVEAGIYKECLMPVS